VFEAWGIEAATIDGWVETGAIRQAG